ncbi:unnamed protein product [Acanthoscelides obtectus]|uniref:Double jelly roll-like domain-containing protein n=1 Tax=Acanthoscelides obtectus TaxID=200917 RepID=A0A9P0QHS4_ACAOB|nr:unnamed protein product [Acanthoscelides obtectus]CAK1656068.1 hypothetical protein AOBTE_LOCUS19558 [Acanthoscelides obtectus]
MFSFIKSSVMSNTFTLTGYTSKLSAIFYPPIELEISAEYGLRLIGFYSYNTIYNIDDQHNKISLTHEGDESNVVTLPEGVYEIEDINKYIQHEIISMNDTYKQRYENNVVEMFSLKANTNTLKCELHSVLDIALSNSMATMLGFKNKIFPRNKIYTSNLPVNITPIRIIRIDCGLISGAYCNAHLYEFDIDVEPGFKLTKEPQNVIYMSVKPRGRQFIDNITLEILDDVGNLVNFRDGVYGVRNPGITSTIKTMVSHGKSAMHTLLCSGWTLSAENSAIWDVKSKVFSGRIPLKHMMGFAEDYKKGVLNIKHELLLVIARSFKNCYVGECDAELTISKIEWKVQHIVPEDRYKVKLLQRLNKHVSSRIKVAFRSWDLYELPSLRSTSSDAWAIRTTSKLEIPLFVIIGFQDYTVEENHLMDIMKFINANVNSIRLKLNNQVFPYERKSAFCNIIDCTYSIFNIQRGVSLVKLNIRVSPR